MFVLGTLWFAIHFLSDCLIGPTCIFSPISFQFYLYVTLISQIFAYLYILYNKEAKTVLCKLKSTVVGLSLSISVVTLTDVFLYFFKENVLYMLA